MKLFRWHPWGVLLGENIMITFIKDESGATAIEYGMISALMFSLIMTAWGGVYFKIADAFDVVVTTLSVA